MGGNLSSRVLNRATKPLREYNIEERAHKAVLRNKYVPSPKHPTSVKHIDKSIHSLPDDIKKSMHESSEILHNRLKSVYVTSTDHDPKIERSTAERPLPLDRNSHEGHEYGFHEPKVVPYGKITLRNSLECITKHQQNPDLHTPESLAIQFKMDHSLTKNILDHFGCFKLVIPESATKKEAKLLSSLRKDSTHIHLTPEVKEALGGITMANSKETSKDSIPYESMKPTNLPRPDHVDDEGMTLISMDEEFMFSDEKGKQDKGMDQYFNKEKHNGKERSPPNKDTPATT